MMKTMEKLMENLAVGDRPPTIQHHETQTRNPNCRRQQFPQIRQRDKKNLVDNQVRPPFQENLVVDDIEEIEDHIQCFDQSEVKFYLTKEEHSKSYQRSNDDFLNTKNDDYKRGYQNAILEFQKQYNLKNRNVVANIDNP